MTMNLIGLEGVDYTKPDGNRVTGIKAYVTHSFASSKKNVTGQSCESLWISSGSDLFEKLRSFNPPCKICVDYEIDGRFSRISDINMLKN